MKRVVAVGVLVCVIVTCLFCAAGCRQKSEQKVTTIGVNQYAQQPILDAVLQGFQERIAQEKGFSVIVKNSNAEALTCQQINEQFVRSNVDVIVALGTPAAQSAVNISRNIPVVFGAITDPVGAKLADSLEKPGGNKTGTTNRWPFEDQVKLIPRVLPKAKRIGIVVNPGEENCNAGMKIIRAASEPLGIDLVEIPVSTSAEVKAATEALTKKVDAILVSPSNTVFSALDTLIGTARENNVPVIGGDETAVRKGSLATYGFRNKDVGIATAEIVLRICRDNVPPGSIPVARPPHPTLFLNQDAARGMGLTFDETLVKEASAGN